MKIGIVGGGITGLSAGYFLAQQGHQVWVYERGEKLGGLAGCFQIQGNEVEKFFHNLSRGDAFILDLLRELDLEKDMIWRKARFGFYYVNQIYRFQSALDVLQFKPLSFFQRIQMGFGVLRIREERDWRSLDGLSAREWVTRWMGKQAYEVVWKPLLKSRFGVEDHENISASWLWAKLTGGGKSKGKTLEDTVGYFQGGFEKLYQRLEDTIVQKGGFVFKGTPVYRICTQDGEVTGLETGKGMEAFDAVIATPAMPVFLNLVDNLPPDYRRNLETFRYLGVVCLALVLKKSLTQSYWLNVNDPDFPFVGVIEHTNLSGDHYQGRRLVYIPKYTGLHSPYYQATAEQLLDCYEPYLRRMFPDFERASVEAAYLWREPYAQPVIERGYGSRIPPFETPVKNLYLATMAQIYPEDRGMNNSVKLAKRLSDEMTKNISASRHGETVTLSGK